MLHLVGYILGYGLLRVFPVFLNLDLSLVLFELHGYEIFKFEVRVYFCQFLSNFLRRELVWL